MFAPHPTKRQGSGCCCDARGRSVHDGCRMVLVAREPEGGWSSVGTAKAKGV
jgi:hypothetical protein